MTNIPHTKFKSRLKDIIHQAFFVKMVTDVTDILWLITALPILLKNIQIVPTNMMNVKLLVC